MRTCSMQGGFLLDISSTQTFWIKPVPFIMPVMFWLNLHSQYWFINLQHVKYPNRTTQLTLYDVILTKQTLTMTCNL